MRDRARVLVAYYTEDGHTRTLANAVLSGVNSCSLVDAELKELSAVRSRDLLEYDGVVLGSPTHWGSMAWQMKRLFDDSIEVYHQLHGKVGGAFSCSGVNGGGGETTVMGILLSLLTHGYILVPQGGSGAIASRDHLDSAVLRRAEALGARVAEVTYRVHVRGGCGWAPRRQRLPPEFWASIQRRREMLVEEYERGKVSEDESGAE